MCFDKANFFNLQVEYDIEETKEFEITIKSKLEFKDYLIEFLNKNSTYDVPQIIYRKYHAEMKYYAWLNKTI